MCGQLQLHDDIEQGMKECGRIKRAPCFSLPSLACLGSCRGDDCEPQDRNTCIETSRGLGSKAAGGASVRMREEKGMLSQQLKLACTARTGDKSATSLSISCGRSVCSAFSASCSSLAGETGVKQKER